MTRRSEHDWLADIISWGERLQHHRAALSDMCRRLNWSFALHRTDRAAPEALISLAGRIAMASHEGAFAPAPRIGIA